MTVLGNLCLWLAFLVGIWGALAGFVGGLRGQPELGQSARHAVVSLFGSLAMVFTARRHRVYRPYVAAVVCTVAAFFISVMLSAYANPFQRLPYTPLDGSGLNPQLQNPGMVFHPPMLYLGYISITIPFAFAMAALLTKKLDADWLVAIRKWTLLSWLFLSIGICLGMWWAYVELGWGGYWAWDPVEN